MESFHNTNQLWNTEWSLSCLFVIKHGKREREKESGEKRERAKASETGEVETSKVYLNCCQEYTHLNVFTCLPGSYFLLPLTFFMLPQLFVLASMPTSNGSLVDVYITVASQEGEGERGRRRNIGSPSNGAKTTMDTNERRCLRCDSLTNDRTALVTDTRTNRHIWFTFAFYYWHLYRDGIATKSVWQHLHDSFNLISLIAAVNI